MIVRTGRAVIDYGPTPAPPTPTRLGGSLVTSQRRTPPHEMPGVQAQYKRDYREEHKDDPAFIAREKARQQAKYLRRKALRAAMKSAA